MRRLINIKIVKYALGLIALLSLNSIAGCQNNQMSREELSPKNKSHIYSNLIKKRGPTISVNEYVSRVGKKILLVSNNPDLNINFNVYNFGNGIKINSDEISIENNVLKTLNDEASLAYVIAAGIEKINNHGNLDAFEQDKEIMHNLERAGYDPRAVVDVQKKYLEFFSGSNYSWVKKLSNHRMSSSRTNKNENYLSNGFNGLKRYKDRYVNIVKPS